MTVSEANAYTSHVAILARKQRAYQDSRTNRDGTRTRAARQTSRDLRAIRTLKGSR